MLRRHNPLGLSMYLSTFGQVHPFFEGPDGEGILVFTSLHISEEFSADYCRTARETIDWLNARGYRVMADVSKKTVAQFGQEDMVAFAREMGLYALRIDYGFTEEEIIPLAQALPIAVNASTVDPDSVRRIVRAGGNLIAMHNFYPRPETGLGDGYFLQTTRGLQALGIPVYAFIPGDGLRRGPLHEGLPTLERHRGWKPLCAYADLIVNFNIDAVFAGDVTLSPGELARIRAYDRTGVLPIPAVLDAGAEGLYDRPFTSRPDSPDGAIRLQESREYSCFGETIAPADAAPRARGSVTVDNANYGRYSGETQILRVDRPADGRVNVVGAVCPEYLPLLDCVPNGTRLMLVRAQ